MMQALQNNKIMQQKLQSALSANALKGKERASRFHFNVNQPSHSKYGSQKIGGI